MTREATPKLLSLPQILSPQNLLFLASPRKNSRHGERQVQGRHPGYSVCARERGKERKEGQGKSGDKDDRSFFKRLVVCGKKLYCKIEEINNASSVRGNFSAGGKSGI